jgi:hypothetical protein
MYENDSSPSTCRTMHAVAMDQSSKQGDGTTYSYFVVVGATLPPPRLNDATTSNPSTQQVNCSMSRLVSVHHLHPIPPLILRRITYPSTATPPTPPWSSSTTPRRSAPSSCPVPNPLPPAQSRPLADGALVGVGIKTRGKDGAWRMRRGKRSSRRLIG